MSNYKNSFSEDAENTSWSLAFKYIKDGADVLEVGCGNGNFAKAIKDHKQCKVVGIEPDTGDAKRAKIKVERIIVDTIENALDILKGKKFDQIVFLDVIEHLYDPVATLKSLKPLLKKDGTIVFSMPNMGHTSLRLMLMNGDFEYGKTGILDHTHLHFYTDREINRVFNEAGYQVEDMCGVELLYPEEVMKNELKKVGVPNPTQKFMKVLNSKNGHIYQYVGYARVSDQKNDIEFLPACSPNPKYVIESYYDDGTKYQQEIQELKDQLAAVSDEKQYYKNTLETLLDSKSWRLLERLKKHLK